jgi:uncharacterized membrane protein YqjE
MQAQPPANVGYLDSLRSLGSGLLEGAHDRFELFTIELQEEKLRLFQTLLWISAGIFAAMLTITFLSLTVVSLVGEAARPIALASMTAVYLVAFGGIGWGLRRHLARRGKPFAGTLSELRADAACIRKSS